MNPSIQMFEVMKKIWTIFNFHSIDIWIPILITGEYIFCNPEIICYGNFDSFYHGYQH